MKFATWLTKSSRSADGYASGQFQRGVVQNQQVNPRGQQDLERIRCPASKVSGHVDVGIGPRASGCAAAMQVREPCPRLPERGDRFRD
jgi:hypothetical protein